MRGNHWHSGLVSRTRHRREYYERIEKGKEESLVPLGTLEEACRLIDPAVFNV